MTQHITLISHVLHENCIKSFVKGPISSQAVPNLSKTGRSRRKLHQFFDKGSDLVPDFIRSNEKDRYPRKLYQICRKKAYLVATCIEYFAQDRPCHKLYGPNVVVFCCALIPVEFTYNQLRPGWRHQMEIFSALLASCVGNSPVPGEFPTQRPVTRSFDVFFDLRPNKRLSKQCWGWWFETPSSPLWRHCNVTGTGPMMWLSQCQCSSAEAYG